MKDPLTTLQLSILATIRRLGDDVLGEDIRTALYKNGDRRTDPVFYEAVNRAESAGIVYSRRIPRDGRPGPRKKRYSLTAAGKALLSKWDRLFDRVAS